MVCFSKLSKAAALVLISNVTVSAFQPRKPGVEETLWKAANSGVDFRYDCEELTLLDEKKPEETSRELYHVFNTKADQQMKNLTCDLEKVGSRFQGDVYIPDKKDNFGKKSSAHSLFWNLRWRRRICGLWEEEIRGM